MLEYFFYSLILLNIFFIFYLKKRKIRVFFHNPKIKSVNLEDVSECFNPDIVDDKLKSPSERMITSIFFVPETWNVVGMTSDYEAWILSVLSKKSKNIFEFGTCSGKTTFLFSLNSPDDAKIYTITLDPSSIGHATKISGESTVAQKNALSESKYNKFMFSKNNNIKSKIEVIFQDSKKLNIDRFVDSLDLIFIDGGHSYSCVKNDTEKSMRMIRKNGLIFWHDYSIGKRSHKDVYKYLNEIRDKYEIFHIRNTSLCFYKKQ